MTTFEGKIVSKDIKVAIVASRFNEFITAKLLSGAMDGLVRHDVLITLIDDSGADGPSWTLINAWPVGYTVPDLNGMGSEVAIQSLELCHEGLEHTPAGVAGEPSPM